MLHEVVLLVCFCFSTVLSAPPGGVAEGPAGMMPPPKSPMDGCMAIPPMMDHLIPSHESDLWMGRWADWFNNTYHAFMEPVVVADQWNDWTLDGTKFKPAKPLVPKTDACGETPDRLIKRQNATTPQELKIRLVGGTNTKEGRLEVFYNNEWGTVCSGGFGEAEAQVVCNALGFKGSAVVRPTTAYGAGTGKIWLTGLHCEARFMHLANCHFNAFGLVNPACTHANDVGVMCLADNWTKMRLIGGSTENEGRVEAFLMGEWGTVCDNGFTWKEAQVVCNGLGYWGKAELLPRGTFNQGATGKIWLDGVKCMPEKPHLAHCIHNEFGTVKSDCTHARDVAVRCSNMTMKYVCMNNVSMEKSWRDRSYNMFNQGGMTQKMMMSLKDMLHMKLAMFSQCKPHDEKAGDKPESKDQKPPSVGGKPGMDGRPMDNPNNVQGERGMMDGHDKPESSDHSKDNSGGVEDLWKVLKAAITAIDYQKMRDGDHHDKKGSDDPKHIVPQEVSSCLDINSPKMPSFVSNEMPCIEDMSPQTMLNHVEKYIHDYMDQITHEAMDRATKPMYPPKPGGVNTTMTPVTMTPSAATPPAIQAGNEIWKCNFDEGVFCPDISNTMVGDQFDWAINEKKVATWYTGPEMDHSKKGKYAYADVTNQKPGNKASLQVKNVMVPSGGACVTFWYHMYGKEQGTFKLWVQNTATQMDNFVWEKSGQQSSNGLDWKSASYFIMTPGTYVITFESQVAAQNQKGEGDVAVDDIVIIRGACPVAPLSG